MKTVVHTLGYNIPTLIEECTESLRELNEGFEYTHVIVDLGYPLSDNRDKWGAWDIHSLQRYKKNNLYENHRVASYYNSDLVKFPNKGVSGNWTTVANLYDIGDGDVLIGADPNSYPHMPLGRSWRE